MQALAFQVGNLVSYNEVGNLVGLNNKTVEKYINLLEQVFVIFRLGSFNRNLRNELKSSRKIYFYDNGVLSTYEFKWNPLKRSSLPKTFSDSYPASTFEVITPSNFESFLGI